MARKSRKQTAAPMPAPSLYVHVALYIRLSVEDNKKRGCSVENQKLVLNDFLSDKPDVLVADVMMPRMDGFEMVRRIRQSDKAIVNETNI